MTRWKLSRILAPLLLLAPLAAAAADAYYPEYKRDPVPPVVIVDDAVVEDEAVLPSCNPANDGCDDPSPASARVALDPRLDGHLASRVAGSQGRITPALLE